MPGRTRVDGSGYTVNGGKDRINGAVYTRAGGKCRVDGAARNITFWTTKHVLLDSETISYPNTSGSYPLSVSVPEAIRSKVIGFYSVATYLHQEYSGTYQYATNCAFFRDGYLCSVNGAGNNRIRISFDSYDASAGALSLSMTGTSSSGTKDVTYYVYCVLANGSPVWTTVQNRTTNVDIGVLPLHTIAAVRKDGASGFVDITNSASYGTFEGMKGDPAEAGLRSKTGSVWSPDDDMAYGISGTNVHFTETRSSWASDNKGFNYIQSVSSEKEYQTISYLTIVR